MLVKFTTEAKVLDGSGQIRQHFAVGQTVDLPTASARHWLNRGMAERVYASVPQSRAATESSAMSAPMDPVKEAEASQEEPGKRRPGRPRKAESGASPESGPAKPSAFSAPGPASRETKSSMSADDAESSPSTPLGNSHPGPMSSTPATPRGGESMETPLDSEG